MVLKLQWPPGSKPLLICSGQSYHMMNRQVSTWNWLSGKQQCLGWKEINFESSQKCQTTEKKKTPENKKTVSELLLFCTLVQAGGRRGPSTSWRNYFSSELSISHAACSQKSSCSGGAQSPPETQSILQLGNVPSELWMPVTIILHIYKAWFGLQRASWNTPSFKM